MTTTTRFLVVAQGSDGSLRVYVALNGCGIDDEREELRVKSNEEEVIVTWYPLEGYLEALGILAEYTLLHEPSFGLALERLLTKMAQDMFKKGFNKVIDIYDGIKEEEAHLKNSE